MWVHFPAFWVRRFASIERCAHTRPLFCMHVKYGRSRADRNWPKYLRRFSAWAVNNLQIGGALTRIILIVAHFCPDSDAERDAERQSITNYKRGATEGSAHNHWVIPFLKGRNGPAYERCRSICLDWMNPQLDEYLVATHSTV